MPQQQGRGDPWTSTSSSTRPGQLYTRLPEDMRKKALPGVESATAALRDLERRFQKLVGSLERGVQQAEERAAGAQP